MGTFVSTTCISKQESCTPAHVFTGIAVLDLHDLAPSKESSISQFPPIGMASAQMLTVAFRKVNLLGGGRHGENYNFQYF